MKCPSNREAIKIMEKLEDITENEIKVLLEGQPDEKVAESLSNKLKMFYPSDADKVLPVIKRNLELLIN